AEPAWRNLRRRSRRSACRRAGFSAAVMVEAPHVDNAGLFRPLIRLLDAAGKPAWELAAGVDIFRAAGWEYVLQHRRDNIAHASLGTGPRDAVYRRIWSDAAAELGAELRELAPGFLELHSGATCTRVHHQSVMLDDAVTVELAL